MKTAISLFSGMGGDTLGLTQAGYNVIAYSEFKKTIRETHEANFNTCELIGSGDITKTTDEELEKYKGRVDLIFAGFPCQGFSQAGKKLPNDPRNTLFMEFVRVVDIIKPTHIIGENVKGLITRKTANGEHYIDVIVKSFEEIGYKIDYKILKANEHDTPQKRERLIILGNNKGLENKFPEPNNNVNSIEHIINFDMTGAIRFDTLEDIVPPSCILTDMDNDDTENDDVHPYLRLKVNSVDTEYNGKVHNSLISFAKRDSPIHCEIVDIRKPTKTIICSYGHQPRFFVPLKNKNGCYIRCLLPDELKQIQGFPASYNLCGNVKDQIIQIGNAVPPPLIKAISSIY